MTRRTYVSRAFAPSVNRHFREHPRCALWAKPGMGKSVLVLTHLDIAYRAWGDDHPTLILGPKRVAKSVWSDEVQKWEHLRGLEVVPIVGTEAERLLALRRNAPIYTANYDVVPWLLDHLGARWRFKRVVADESTKLKNFRLRNGGRRAQALTRVAHTFVEEWINLTGTPSPNGLRDLWGQTWFLDAGQRLGTSFSDFESRWFAWRRVKDAVTHKPGLKQEIMPAADRQIHAALADICLTLDPKDWFELHDPVVNVIGVDMPASARAKYKELEKELFLQLDTGESVEVFNAAALTMKCLQLANGAVYLEDGEQWRVLHDEKLDALEDLAEETGEPILVAYHFKSDLARLLARFPDGIDLSTDRGMAAAKRGEGRLWFGHPAGMGHGVDGLQEHCSTVAVFGHWWDLEQYDQIIERVGPMRQYQAGKDRPVFIHQIVARRTIDEVVVARRAGKRSVQQALMDYMKENR